MSSSLVDLCRDGITLSLERSEQAVRLAKSMTPALAHTSVEIASEAWEARYPMLPIPQFARDRAANGLNAAAQQVYDTMLDGIDQLQIYTQLLGSPDDLRAVAAAIGGIGDKANQLVIQPDALAGLLSWDDPPASRTYELGIAAQNEWLQKIQPFASGVADALSTQADDIEQFYVQSFIVIAGLYVSLLGIIGAILSLIGGAMTAGTGVGAVLGIIGAVMGLVTAVAGLITAALGALPIALTVMQGNANKIAALSADLPNWDVPAFAEVE